MFTCCNHCHRRCRLSHCLVQNARSSRQLNDQSEVGLLLDKVCVSSVSCMRGHQKGRQLQSTVLFLGGLFMPTIASISFHPTPLPRGDGWWWWRGVCVCVCVCVCACACVCACVQLCMCACVCALATLSHVPRPLFDTWQERR